MAENKILVWVLGIIGAFYTFLPHSLHQLYAPDWLFGLDFSHFIHVSIGIILLIITFVMVRK